MKHASAQFRKKVHNHLYSEYIILKKNFSSQMLHPDFRQRYGTWDVHLYDFSRHRYHCDGLFLFPVYFHSLQVFVSLHKPGKNLPLSLFSIENVLIIRPFFTHSGS